jgi:hypothetical protein
LKQARYIPDLAMGSFNMLVASWSEKSELALVWTTWSVGGERRVAAGEDGVWVGIDGLRQRRRRHALAAIDDPRE